MIVYNKQIIFFAYRIKDLYRFFLDKNWMVIKTPLGKKDFTLTIFNKIDDEIRVPDINFIGGEWK